MLKVRSLKAPFIDKFYVCNYCLCNYSLVLLFKVAAMLKVRSLKAPFIDKIYECNSLCNVILLLFAYSK